MTMHQWDELPDQVRDAVDERCSDRRVDLETWIRNATVELCLKEYFAWEGIDLSYVDDVIEVLRVLGHEV